ncbi:MULTISPECIES: hypothetical protein [unclassified Sphingomonas]|jgi:hypothetical protein|nr:MULTISPECIES: hypothetical protein [unclassified Sphingomonas]
MSDPEHPELPAAAADEPQGARMAPQTEEDAVKPTTKEIDTDDMFNGQGV